MNTPRPTKTRPAETRIAETIPNSSRRRRQALCSFATLSLLWLTGCGGSDGVASSPSPGSDSPSPTPTPSPPPAPVSPAPTTYGDFRGASVGPLANVNGAVAFPASNAWNTDISGAPVDPASGTILGNISASATLFPDFGSGTWNGTPIGIPYTVVAGSQAKVAILMPGSSESDPGPYPIPPDANVESSGDRHAIVIDRDNNRLYELFNASKNADNSWTAESAAVFHLDSNNVRPTAQPGWTSADAAGLPIFPGLARYEEAARGAGGIRHALRFTLSQTRNAYVAPATHANGGSSASLPPMGMRVRLRASFPVPSTMSAEGQAILTALKTYGMFLADNGSNWYMSGCPDPRWNNELLKSELRQVKTTDLEIVQMTGLVVMS